MYVSLWLNTVAAAQMFSIQRFFFFLHNVFKEDGNNNKCKQILKFYL